jgi:hypothetical protein
MLPRQRVGMLITRPRRVFALALISVLAAFVVAGCGSSSSPSTSSAASSQDAARVKFSQCMRQNGVDIPDRPGQGGAAALQDIDRAKLQTAIKACQKFQQAAVGNLSSSQRQSFQDAFTKFASCMRQHGVELPAPGTGGGPPAGGARIDLSDPKVKAATTACRSMLPQAGPGGGGPGGGPGGGGQG